MRQPQLILHLVLVLVLVRLGAVATAQVTESVGSSTEEAVPLDLFVFAGQSNMVGADADAAELPESDLDQRVLFWWATGDPPADPHDSTSGGKWTDLKPQPKGDPLPRNYQTRQYGNYLTPSGYGFGPEVGFARRRLSSVSEKQSDPAFAILKVAYSGTSVEDDWDPGRSADEGNCYGELLKQYAKANHEAATKGFRLQPAAFFWVQGESDAGSERRGKYQARLQTLLDSVRQQFDSPKLPVLLAINTRFQEPHPGIPVIIDAQKSIASSDPHCLYVDTSDASIANRVHFDAAGTLAVGTRFAERLRSLVDEESDDTTRE